MRDQIARELDTDPMDGGITIPDAGDGITRYPQDGAGGMVPADDIAKYDGEAPPGDDKGDDKEKPVEDDFDKSITVKGKRKWVENLLMQSQMETI